MDIVIYNPNVNAFTSRNIHTWARNNGCDLVLELHLNAVSNPTAHGYETLKDFNQPNRKVFNDIHNAMVRKGWRDRGFKPCNGGGGRNLQNPRLMRQVGIDYILLEFCFITNANDMLTYDQNIDEIPKAIIDSCRNNGIRKLGIVYGHGGRDPGAVGVNGRREALEVRRINFTSVKREPLPTNSIGEITVTASKLNVRVQPNASATSIGFVYRTNTRPTFKKVGTWYQIVFENQVGYVHADYVNFNKSREDELDMTQDQLNKLLDEREKATIDKVLKILRPGDSVGNHWSDGEFDEFNTRMIAKGESPLSDKRPQDVITRAEVVTMINKESK